MGFALLFYRDGQSIAAASIDNALASLSRLGPDGIRTWQQEGGSIALGQANLFSTPEDNGCYLPLMLADDNLVIAFDGRLDNRSELLADLTAPNKPSNLNQSSPDAAIITQAYIRWGLSCCDHLQGPAALIIVDYHQAHVLLFRDALGSRPLYYYLTDKRLLAASEPIALLSQPNVSSDLNQTWLASYFTFSTAPPTTTPFAEIKELLPGERLLCSRDTLQLNRPTLHAGTRQILYQNDADYAEHFHELVDRSVANCLRSSGGVGVMLSGGMDSGPIAAVAQAQLAAAGSAITAYSWSIPAFPSADESTQIRTCADFLGIKAELIASDDKWPLSQPETWPICLNTPTNNGFRRAVLAVYQVARDNNCKVLLNGNFGDNLYPNFSYHMLEMLQDRKLGLFLSEVAWLLGKRSPRAILNNSAVRKLIKQAIRWKARPPATTPLPWLTPHAISLREPPVIWPVESTQHARPDQFSAMLGLNIARGISGETHFANQYGIDRREPYQDMALIDFMLSIPSYQCLRRGQTKLIARNAMKGLIPESIRLAPRTGLLYEFFNFGIAQSQGWIKTLLFTPDCEWPHFVEKTWLEHKITQKIHTETERMVIWQCIAFELWRKALLKNGFI